MFAGDKVVVDLIDAGNVAANSAGSSFALPNDSLHGPEPLRLMADPSTFAAVAPVSSLMFRRLRTSAALLSPAAPERDRPRTVGVGDDVGNHLPRPDDHASDCRLQITAGIRRRSDGLLLIFRHTNLDQR